MRYILLLFPLLTIVSYGQNKPDSLYAIWKNEALADSTRVNSLQKYFWAGILFADPDSAIELADELIAFSKEQKVEKALSVALNTKGVAYAILGDHVHARIYFEKNLAIYRAKGASKYVASELMNIGASFAEESNYIKALEYFKGSLNEQERSGTGEATGSTLHNIGGVYEFLGDDTKALEYYDRSLLACEKEGHRNAVANVLNSIGSIYTDRKDYRTALDYIERSLTIHKEMSNQRGVAECMVNIANIYLEQGERSMALDHFRSSLNINRESDHNDGVATCLAQIGTIYAQEGQHDKALKSCTEALSIANRINNPKRQMESCSCLYAAHKALGHGDKALYYYELEKVYKDSINIEETGKRLQQMEFDRSMYADSLKQVEESLRVTIAHQLEIAKREKTRNVFLAGGILLLILAIGLYSRMRFVRESKQRIEIEKQRSDELLLNILPAEIAQELKDKGEAQARNFDQVSILFTDFKAFTQASEKLTASELVEEINICFKAFDEIVNRLGVEKIKTIGDAYMAAGGLPKQTPDSAVRTVIAALEMQKFMTDRKRERMDQGLTCFEMRAGIHTGPVVAGIVGTRKFQYDIWGDTVNIAARMESSAEVGKVNISEATYAIINDEPRLRSVPRGQIEVKGKGEMAMYFVQLDPRIA